MGLKGLENHGLMRYDMVPFGTCMALGVVFYYMYVLHGLAAFKVKAFKSEKWERREGVFLPNLKKLGSPRFNLDEKIHALYSNYHNRPGYQCNIILNASFRYRKIWKHGKNSCSGSGHPRL